MNKNHENVGHKSIDDIRGQILSAGFRASREGQIAEARAEGFAMIGISAVGVIGGSSETQTPIDSANNPKLVRPFKKWLRRNGYTDFIESIK